MTWLLFVTVVPVYVVCASRGLVRGALSWPSALVIMMLPVATFFIRRAIEGGTVSGAARGVIALSLLILVATLGRPYKLFDVKYLAPPGSQVTREMDKRTQISQIIFIGGVAVGAVVYAVSGWTFLE